MHFQVAERRSRNQDKKCLIGESKRMLETQTQMQRLEGQQERSQNALMTHVVGLQIVSLIAKQQAAIAN